MIALKQSKTVKFETTRDVLRHFETETVLKAMYSNLYYIL